MLRLITVLFLSAVIILALGCAGKNDTAQDGKGTGGTSAKDKEKKENVLVGYWEIQKITVDGKEDGGGAGAYWIFRENGTFKIVKRGRNSEGKWSVNPERRLLMEIEGKSMLDGVWKREKDTLVIQAELGNSKVVFSFVKRALKAEPKEPRRI